MNLVIIGGDASQIIAASRSKRTDPNIEVVVLEQTYDVSYIACGMPYNIANPKRDMKKFIVKTAYMFLYKTPSNIL
ncbi:hypothetical protein [Desulfobacula phenolica]|uniref:Uncharacterized protein n=1 Tax=Desulfobacula phenolica TaxID=90732 RepID=A0A1H2JVF3_9BACT|nr:hypothetical protein [Desulfobacula phenolica]SDU60055.1 hypothetical protein SAMN04487931_1162 [Desulfobacula phenolica]